MNLTAVPLHLYCAMMTDKDAGGASPLARPYQPAALQQAESAGSGALAQLCLAGPAEWRTLLILCALLCTKKEHDFKEHAGLLQQWTGHTFIHHICPRVASARHDNLAGTHTTDYV